MFPWSWHVPIRLPAGKYGMNNALNQMGFADGHANMVKMFWNESLNVTAISYDPPAGCDYQWSGE